LRSTMHLDDHGDIVQIGSAMGYQLFRTQPPPSPTEGGPPIWLRIALSVLFASVSAISLVVLQ